MDEGVLGGGTGDEKDPFTRGNSLIKGKIGLQKPKNAK